MDAWSLVLIVAGVLLLIALIILIRSVRRRRDRLSGRLEYSSREQPVTLEEIELAVPFSQRVIRPLLQRLEHILGRKPTSAQISTGSPAPVPVEAPAAQGEERVLPGLDVPGGVIDRVHFSVTSPSIVRPGLSFAIDVWAHLAEQRELVLQRARAASPGEVRLKSKGPVPLARGTLLTVRLKVDGLIVEEAEDTLLWEGEIGNATFAVSAPDDVAEGPRLGLATIHANGLRIARINFELTVGKAASAVADIPAHEERHRTAFASYASADRDEVLARVQGMQKIAPTLDVFLDVLSLRSGQYWEQELWKVIPASDVFYLFWSDNALRSTWVEKEWRCGLQARGLDFIEPVPLVPPEVAPPPPELASKHFNDWVLAFRRPAGSRATD